jgi:hypothetical protein
VCHVSLPSSYRSRRGHIHLLRVLPLVGCRSKTPKAIAMITTPRGRRRGSWASPLRRTRRQSRRGVAMSPAWRSTGATCRGHPRRRYLAALKCHRRAGRGRRGATRLRARAHVRRLPHPSGPAVGPLLCGAQRDGHFRVVETYAPSSRSSEKVGGATGVRPPAL